jgi:hypothetical protein
MRSSGIVSGWRCGGNGRDTSLPTRHAAPEQEHRTSPTSRVRCAQIGASVRRQPPGPAVQIDRSRAGEQRPPLDPPPRWEPSGADTDLPISRTLRIRGTRQNASTDHLRQNVERSRRGAEHRSAPLAPVTDPALTYRSTATAHRLETADRQPSARSVRLRSKDGCNVITDSGTSRSVVDLRPGLVASRRDINGSTWPG